MNYPELYELPKWELADLLWKERGVKKNLQEKVRSLEGRLAFALQKYQGLKCDGRGEIRKNMPTGAQENARGIERSSRAVGQNI